MSTQKPAAESILLILSFKHAAHLYKSLLLHPSLSQKSLATCLSFHGLHGLFPISTSSLSRSWRHQNPLHFQKMPSCFLLLSLSCLGGILSQCLHKFHLSLMGFLRLSIALMSTNNLRKNRPKNWYHCLRFQSSAETTYVYRQASFDIYSVSSF